MTENEKIECIQEFEKHMNSKVVSKEQFKIDDFNTLPIWLQELWDVNSSVARQAENFIIDSEIEILKNLQKHIDCIQISPQENIQYTCGYYNAYSELSIHITTLISKLKKKKQ